MMGAGELPGVQSETEREDPVSPRDSRCERLDARRIDGLDKRLEVDGV